MAASIGSLLGEISSVEDPIEELQCLKTALLAIPVSTLRDAVSGQRFDVIFSLLTSNDRFVWHRWISSSPVWHSGVFKRGDSRLTGFIVTH